ncbi:hypothetical protein J4Q44_G00286090, partial [Coregonus suidteri]
LEEEVGGADVSEVSTSSLTPTEARQGLLGKIPSLLPGEILIEDCMADTIAHVIGDYAQDWSSDGHFGARRSLGSGRSRSSSSSSKSDITLTEELLAQGETLEEDQEEVAAIDDNKKCDSASLEKASSSSLSADLVDSTSTQTVKDEAVKEGVRKSGEGKRGRKKTLKKNKVSPLGTDDTVADEPGKKRSLLLRITAALAKLFCFPCKKRSGKKVVVWVYPLRALQCTCLLSTNPESTEEGDKPPYSQPI